MMPSPDTNFRTRSGIVIMIRMVGKVYDDDDDDDDDDNDDDDNDDDDNDDDADHDDHDHDDNGDDGPPMVGGLLVVVGGHKETLPFKLIASHFVEIQNWGSC